MLGEREEVGGVLADITQVQVGLGENSKPIT